MDDRKKTLLFTIINAFLFISTIIVTIVTLAFGTVAGQVDTGINYGWFYIATFTVESNIFLDLVAGVATALGVRSLVKRVPLPQNLTVWYFIATTSAMLTCLMVIFFLAPVRALRGKNYFEMMMGPMFFFHFFNPLLAGATLIFLTAKPKLTLKHRLLTLVPPLLYAILYITNVVVLSTWIDFYGFTFGGQTALVLPVLLGVCLFVFGIASGLAFCHNRVLVRQATTTPKS